MPEERRYSLQDACHLLSLNSRQLHRYLEDLGIEPLEDPRDARRKDLSEGHLAQLRDLLQDDLADGRRHGLERRVALLERRVVFLERLVQSGSVESVPAAPVVPDRPPRPSQSSSASSGGLPDDWISLNEACTRYGVNVNTAKMHVRQGTLGCHKGLWRSGMTRIEYALDPDEQVAFRAHFGVAT